MTKREDEFFQKNNELSHELSKYVIEHPEMDSLLSGESVVIFLPEFDPDLWKFNIEMAREIEREGEKVVYVKVKQMMPKIASRLIGVEVRSGEIVYS
jgi:phage pi2 protein 07